MNIDRIAILQRHQFNEVADGDLALALTLYESFDALAQSALTHTADQTRARLIVTSMALLLAASHFHMDDIDEFLAAAADAFDTLQQPADA